MAVRTRIYPGVIDTLEAMRASGLRLGVVTNKAEACSPLPLLERMGIAHYFDRDRFRRHDWRTRSRIPNRSWPAAASACGRTASLHDRRLGKRRLAARAAGMPVLLRPYGYNEGKPVDTIECDALLSEALHIAYRQAAHSLQRPS
jgi:phosphoglycolate phosphatase